jgi:hypothetical protein
MKKMLVEVKQKSNTDHANRITFFKNNILSKLDIANIKQLVLATAENGGEQLNLITIPVNDDGIDPVLFPSCKCHKENHANDCDYILYVTNIIKERLDKVFDFDYKLKCVPDWPNVKIILHFSL